MKQRSWTESLAERFATALVSAFAAALTLLLYPLALLLLSGGSGGGAEFHLGALIYAFAFSKIGISVIIGAAIIGFCVGADRMADIFAFFWGTHSFWAKLGAYVEDKAEALRTEHNAPLWLLAVLLFILAAIILAIYVRP